MFKYLFPKSEEINWYLVDNCFAASYRVAPKVCEHPKHKVFLQGSKQCILIFEVAHQRFLFGLKYHVSRLGMKLLGGKDQEYFI